MFLTKICVSLILCLAALTAIGCAGEEPSGALESLPSQSAASPLNVVATVSPITSIVENIGGTRIALEGVVPEGVNSHTFEPAPAVAVALSGADLIFLNGLFLEEPTLEMAKANLKPGAAIVSLGDETITPDQWQFDFSFPEADGQPNPHLWPDPILSLRYAEIVRYYLAKKDAANADYYRANYDAFAARIATLDEAIKAAIPTIPAEKRKLLTYHDSWAYFADRYGLTVIGGGPAVRLL